MIPAVKFEIEFLARRIRAAKNAARRPHHGIRMLKSAIRGAAKLASPNAPKGRF
jgi:hypothetical protein